MDTILLPSLMKGNSLTTDMLRLFDTTILMTTRISSTLSCTLALEKNRILLLQKREKRSSKNLLKHMALPKMGLSMVLQEISDIPTALSTARSSEKNTKKMSRYLLSYIPK